jgi:hypothetical protein
MITLPIYAPNLQKLRGYYLNRPPVLTNPFPHNQHLASSSSNAGNAAGGGQNQQLQDGDRLCINMVDAKIDVATRSRDYSSKQTIPGLESPPPPPEMTLQIEKPEPPPRILKGVLKRSTHNPNARAAQNYSIVEDLGQTPCAMSALEVLQTCPSQRNALLSALGALEPSGSKLSSLTSQMLSLACLTMWLSKSMWSIQSIPSNVWLLMKALLRV